jgi:RNase P subunit RPR2
MSTNILRMVCPNLSCRTILSVPAEARGKDVRCRACGSKIRIPLAKAAPVVPAAAPQAEAATTDGSADKLA